MAKIDKGCHNYVFLTIEIFASKLNEENYLRLKISCSTIFPKSSLEHKKYRSELIFRQATIKGLFILL